MMNFKQFHKRLNEGGAFGHLAHPFDVNTFTFDDLKELIVNLLTGNIDYAEEKCLDGSTMVQVDGKFQRIDEVVDNGIGSTILSYDGDSNSFIEKEILGRVMNGIQSEWIKIELEDGKSIDVTPTHRMLVEGKGYVPACELKECDELIIWNE